MTAKHSSPGASAPAPVTALREGRAVEAELRVLADGRSRLRWSGGPITIHVPTCAAFELAGARVIEQAAGAGELWFEPGHLPSPWLYFASGSGGGRWLRDRTLGLRGAANLRDLGGYRGLDGRRIRWRRLFRANRLDRLADDELDCVADLGIVAVCDLRSAEEREMERSRWREAPPTQLHSAKASNGEIRDALMGGAPDEAKVIARMKAFYAGLPRRFADEYRALFEALASGQTPFLFHCTAGKDRTGVAAAILLDLLGASHDQIVADYCLTDELLEPERQARLDRSALGGDDRDVFAALAPAARLAVWRAHPDYIGAALESVVAEFGSSESYLEHLGLPIGTARRIRDRLLVREGEEHL